MYTPFKNQAWNIGFTNLFLMRREDLLIGIPLKPAHTLMELVVGAHSLLFCKFLYQPLLDGRTWHNEMLGFSKPVRMR